MRGANHQGTGPVAVIGGAGFIGSNLAHSLLADGLDVHVIDNLSRPGVVRNLEWLRETGEARLRFTRADVTDAAGIEAAIGNASAVFHFAGQTAVTTSLDDPEGDFRVNALGTLNVLEAVRRSGRRVPVIYSSTNKVYGGLDDLAFEEGRERYEPVSRELRQHGISERQPLHLCTPYGCSKGAADQYVLDYASSYSLPTAVLRMSCIYGPRQFGTEDQGWVAHFLIQALEGRPITIYGDGKQVRDILFVEDAVAAYRALLHRIDAFSGRAFNLGGGPANAVSLNLVLAEIEKVIGQALPISHSEWRQGDQPYFVADTRALQQALGWHPKTRWQAGLRRLFAWLKEMQAVQDEPILGQRALA